MIERRWLRHLSKVAAAGLLAACGSDDASSFSSGAPSRNGDSESPNDPGGAAGSFGRDDAGVPLEREEESAFESPVATGKFVWIANPQSGRVAYINAETLDVRTVEAGNGPTFLAAVPSGESAIVLNVLSEDATLFRANGTNVERKTFKTAPGMNAWSTSPDGRWAIAWADARTSPKNSDKTQGFQDLTVIDVSGQIPPKVLAVGYRPVKVGFTSQGTRAYAVTQDGVALVDLTQPGGPLLTKNVALSDDPLEDPGTRDVSVTPSGAYALIRRDNRADVSVLSLESGARVTATLPGSVTDLDLTSSGDKAVAVIRQSSTVAILPVPDIFANPSTFTTVTVTGETIGSVALAPGGNTGLLYTNAVGTEHLTVMALAQNPSPTYRTVRLYSPVLSVFAADDARHAVVIHEVGTGSKGAFSLVPIGVPLPAKIVSTDGRPTSVAFAPAGDRAIVAEGGGAKGGNVYGAYLATLPEFMVTRYPLASPPTAVGVMASAHRAYVAQKHPEGRITFIDMDGGRARTLTGFELAARVVDGSKP